MIFELYKNSKIGFKLLSKADLGMGAGGTTAIGLYADTLSFIDDFFQYSFAQLIYEDTSKELLSFLDPIQNPDGSKRSPKIRSGNKKELIFNSKIVNSVVREIRTIADSDKNSEWFLMWFGLKNKDLVFFLIKKDSKDYKSLQKITGKLSNKMKFEGYVLNNIINYLNAKVNDVNDDYLKDLETAVQICDTGAIRRINPKEIDLHKAQKLLVEIGKQGEELLCEYFERLKLSSEIKNYKWMNKDRESGMPYDFEIIDMNGNKYFSDAKSTSYNFQRNMFFSSNELKFINDNNNYLIHRIYNMKDKASLKISKNISKVTDDFVKQYSNCQENLAKNGLKLNSVKIEIPPELEILSFEDELNFII